MRAPPVAEKHTSGIFSASASSAARVNFSPTTEPIEPPMKVNSNAHAASGMRLQLATHRDQRVLLAGDFLRSGDTIAVFLRILELQRIDRLHLLVELPPRRPRRGRRRAARARRSHGGDRISGTPSGCAPAPACTARRRSRRISPTRLPAPCRLPPPSRYGCGLSSVSATRSWWKAARVERQGYQPSGPSRVPSREARPR